MADSTIFMPLEVAMKCGITVPDQAEQLRKMVLSQFQCDELYVNEASAAAATHNGEGLVDFGFYGSD